MNPLPRSTRLLLLLSCLTAAPLWAADPAPAAAPSTAVSTLLERQDLAPYRGWLKYLRLRVEQETARGGADSEAARAAAQRLADWARRIEQDPALLGKLRGVQEWAYESAADGSGQPFKIMIPTDYDPTNPPGMSVYMHGLTGDHLKHSTGIKDRAGDFDIAVLGRSRGGSYLGLSGADVLDVIKYVQTHWKIDDRRIQLTGGSMGGGGIFKLGSRYPHLFASGLITCGFTTQEPINNLLTLPLYATHSADDPVVGIITARGPLQTVRERGGRNVFDETNGLGHAAWDFAEGNRRAAAWAQGEVRPRSQDVLRIDFTALDGEARRGWWAEVAEWGAEPRPARFILTASRANALNVELRNVGRLTLHLEEAPFDRARPLVLSVNGQPAVTVPAPLPAKVDLTPTGIAAPTTTTRRLHAPGGAYQLYNGEPLLIVYGTRGAAALKEAAEAAARSWNPGWPTEGEGRDPGDGVPFFHNLFGTLPVKADRDVTAEDLARNHLVLIGNTEENSVVERLSAGFPLRVTATEIVCSDGASFPRAGNAWGLVHLNPEAPDRLVFWVGSDTPVAYAAGAVIPALHGSGFHAADLVIADPAKRTVIATRSLTAQWGWANDRGFAKLPSSLTSQASLANAVAEAARRAAGCDYAIATSFEQLGATPFDPATASVRDVANLAYNDLIDVLELTGAQLQTLDTKFRSPQPGPPRHLAVQPALDPAAIQPDKVYRVAVSALTAFHAGRVILDMPVRQQRTELTLADAIERFLPGRRG